MAIMSAKGFILSILWAKIKISQHKYGLREKRVQLRMGSYY